MVTTEDIKRGFKYYDRWGEWRVMTVSDGWYMCRRKGNIPTVFMVKYLVEALNDPSASLRLKPFTSI